VLVVLATLSLVLPLPKVLTASMEMAFLSFLNNRELTALKRSITLAAMEASLFTSGTT
jgi:hypothetical protein